jgi:hypothetical protein
LRLAEVRGAAWAFSWRREDGMIYVEAALCSLGWDISILRSYVVELDLD